MLLRTQSSVFSPVAYLYFWNRSVGETSWCHITIFSLLMARMLTNPSGIQLVVSENKPEN